MAGRIEKRGENSWRLEVSLGYDENGKQIRKRKTVKSKNKTEARKLLAAFVTELEAGEYIDPVKVTFGQVAEDWRDKHAAVKLSLQTITMYDYQLEGYILPAFGKKRIDQIKPMHVTEFLHNLAHTRNDGKEGGLSTSTIQKNYNVLSSVFKFAQRNELIRHNPVEKAEKPTVRHKKYDVYTTEEVGQLFSLLKEEPVHQQLIVKLAISVGMRRGEILGLQWEDIDFETGRIHIQYSLTCTKQEGCKLSSTKTGESRKVIAPKYLIEELKAYYHVKKKDRLLAGELWKGNGLSYVFSSSLGKPLYPTVPSTWWRRFLDRVNKQNAEGNKPPFKKIRFHDLRHTAATLLINQDVHPKIISERLGHSDIKVTMNTYGHFLEEADRSAADKLDNLFNSPRSVK